MSLSNFPIERLPLELQPQVWSHAAAPPPGTEAASRDLLRQKTRPDSISYPYCSTNYQNPGGPADLPRWSTSNVAGQTVCGQECDDETCKSAKLVALEAWKRDLHAIQNAGVWNRVEWCEILEDLVEQPIKGLKEGKKDLYW